jgi:uncharacterized membrane protein YkoI
MICTASVRRPWVGATDARTIRREEEIVRTLLGWSVAAAVLVGLAFAAGARADEEKIPLDKVPKAVIDAVKAKFPGAELSKDAAKEEDKGKVEYEVTLKYKGYSYDVTATPDGKIVSIEKTIPEKELPKAVAAAVAAKYPKATIKIAEEVTKGEKVVYEVHLVTADNTMVEVVLDPAGKVISEEKAEKKEEKKKG